MPCSTRSDARDRGQSTVELALALPVLCVVLLLVVQVALVAAHRLAVQLAAREAARAAAIDTRPDAAEAAANHAVALRPMAVATRESDGLVTATVTYTDPTDVPLVGVLLPPVELRARMTMAIEPPDGGG